MPYITTGERIEYDRGKVEGQEEKAIVIAINLLKQGIPIDVIAQATGVSIAELQQLQTKSE